MQALSKLLLRHSSCWNASTTTARLASHSLQFVPCDYACALLDDRSRGHDQFSGSGTFQATMIIASLWSNSAHACWIGKR